MNKSSILKKLLKSRENEGRISDDEILKRIQKKYPNLNEINDDYFEELDLFPDDDIYIIKISEGWIIKINGYERFVVDEKCEIFPNNDDFLRKYINKSGKKMYDGGHSRFPIYCNFVNNDVKKKIIKNLKMSFCDLKNITEEEIFYHDEKENYEKVLIKMNGNKWNVIKNNINLFVMDENFNLE